MKDQGCECQACYSGRRADVRIERHGAITVDRTHGRLRIGNQTFTPDEFEAAFLALGFRIVLARDVPGRKGAIGSLGTVSG